MRIGDYYMTALLYEPPDFTSREFGFRKNGEKMVRHKAFSSAQKLRTFLIENAPNHVYFSSSKYEDPAAYPMEDKKKGWQGSDLVFDIDYDHLKRPTLKEAKKQSEKLLVILKDDLGFRKLLYVDSGSRGFHVHVHDECVQKLGNPERREIADFIGHYKTRRGRKIINPNWVEIDTVVTTDFTRLIRLPGSLNVKPDSARPCAIISGPSLLFDHGQISHCGAGFFRQFSPPYKLAGQSQNMSWETFVVGTLEIVPRLSEEKKAKIIEEFEEILETDLIWDDPAKEYKVSHIN